MISYQELVEQRDVLRDLSRSGVRAADFRLESVCNQISAYQHNPNIFEPTFVHQKPGYNLKLVKSLVYQAGKGSKVAISEIQRYANWVVAQMGDNK